MSLSGRWEIRGRLFRCRHGSADHHAAADQQQIDRGL